ncbi:hypothetical protein [Polaromonas sp.]|uniref:hypothetical protein n=1 Tax=Polaromonas sp. TaxID=1869339 RepID=UPI00273123C4|nr:hypothetical protein [Polaromonas sp.]MDP1886614.1 hypothetical protein [Polaromonas sp.]
MSSPDKSVKRELDQLRVQLACVGSVGQYNSRDVILRDSVLDLVDRARNMYRAPYPVATIHAKSLRMEISKDQLLFAAENHPDFWDGKSGMDVPNLKISDFDAFALEFVREINREAEDGSTMLTRMLDSAIRKAVESGCEGVEEVRGGQ